MTLVPLSEQLQRADPQRILVHHRGRDWTYGEILAAARGVAAWLADRGVRPGERVAMALPNSAEYIASYFGIQMAGACAVTLDAGLPAGDLVYAIDHSGAVAAILSPAAQLRVAGASAAISALRSLLVDGPAGSEMAGTSMTQLAVAMQMRTSASPTVTVPLESAAQIIYTSGTTGRAKGVVLSHKNLAANTDSIVASLSLRDGDSVFAILPFSYSYGNSLLLTHVRCGGRVIAASDFVFWNDALDLMQRQRASGFAGIPSSFAMLVNRSDFLRRKWPDLRYITCAGGALPLPLVDRIRQQLSHVSLFLMYGQTEASARLSCLPPHELARRLGSAGRAIPGVRLTIRDESGLALPPGEIGEVVAQGENIMAGYWHDPQATARALRDDGLHTGDFARMDAEGYLYISGRRDDMIKSGGYRIEPQEIEDAVLQVDGVADVGVTGVPDEVLSAIPVAFVVARVKDESLPTRIRAHLSAVLPRYKVPRDIHVVTELPRTANGKLQRRKLAELVPALRGARHSQNAGDGPG